MKRIGTGWMVIGSLLGLLGLLGCSDAIYRIGQLQADSTPPDASTSDAPDGSDDASGGTGGTAGSGGTGGVGGTGGTGGSGGTGGTVACTPKREVAQRKGLNLYLMVDSSFAIALQPAWGQLTQAITMFMQDPASVGVGVGINYFGTSCNARDYSTPRVAVAPLPGVAASIMGSYPVVPLDGVAASIAAAVDGAIVYASALETADPDRETDVLFITDGLFDLACGEGIAEATLYAGAGLNSRPSIQTHVIAIDSGLLDPLNTVDLAPLDGLAMAGGTGQAQRVQVSLNSTMQIFDALKQARLSAAPCAFKLPPDFELSHTLLEWSETDSPDATPEVWAPVANEAACGTRKAMYQPSGSDYLVLCPYACAGVVAAPESTMELRQDCP